MRFLKLTDVINVYSTVSTSTVIKMYYMSLHMHLNPYTKVTSVDFRKVR